MSIIIKLKINNNFKSFEKLTQLKKTIENNFIGDTVVVMPDKNLSNIEIYSNTLSEEEMDNIKKQLKEIVNKYFAVF